MRMNLLSKVCMKLHKEDWHLREEMDSVLLVYKALMLKAREPVSYTQMINGYTLIKMYTLTIMSFRDMGLYLSTLKMITLRIPLKLSSSFQI